MYTIKKNDYLIHYGVKGMKWGVRKDKERKQAADYYRTNNKKLAALKKQTNTQGQKLINKSKGMRRDFGKYSNVDDEEFFELVARTEHHLNTTEYWNAYMKEEKFVSSLDRKTMKKGKKYVRKGY